MLRAKQAWGSGAAPSEPLENHLDWCLRGSEMLRLPQTLRNQVSVSAAPMTTVPLCFFTVQTVPDESSRLWWMSSVARHPLTPGSCCGPYCSAAHQALLVRKPMSTFSDIYLPFVLLQLSNMCSSQMPIFGIESVNFGGLIFFQFFAFLAHTSLRMPISCLSSVPGNVADGNSWIWPWFGACPSVGAWWLTYSWMGTGLWESELE